MADVGKSTAQARSCAIHAGFTAVAAHLDPDRAIVACIGEGVVARASVKAARESRSVHEVEGIGASAAIEHFQTVEVGGVSVHGVGILSSKLEGSIPVGTVEGIQTSAAHEIIEIVECNRQPLDGPLEAILRAQCGHAEGERGSCGVGAVVKRIMAQTTLHRPGKGNALSNAEGIGAAAARDLVKPDKGQGIGTGVAALVC